MEIFDLDIYFNDDLLEHVKFNAHEQTILEYDRINTEQKYRAYGISFDRKPTFEILERYFESRIPPRNTPNSDALLRRCGLISYNLFKIILITQGRNYKDKVWFNFRSPITEARLDGGYYDKYECIDIT